jgi:hypothetical protein
LRNSFISRFFIGDAIDIKINQFVIASGSKFWSLQCSSKGRQVAAVRTSICVSVVVEVSSTF